MPPLTHADAARPQDDDVVIIYANGRWEVGLASQRAGVSWPTYDGARAVVSRFAEHWHVDVWVSRDGGQSYTSAVRCRALAPGRLGANDNTPATVAVVPAARGVHGPERTAFRG